MTVGAVPLAVNGFAHHEPGPGVDGPVDGLGTACGRAVDGARPDPLTCGDTHAGAVENLLRTPPRR
jgi:hypothetical protein